MPASRRPSASRSSALPYIVLAVLSLLIAVSYYLYPDLVMGWAFDQGTNMPFPEMSSKHARGLGAGGFESHVRDLQPNRDFHIVQICGFSVLAFSIDQIFK